MATKKKTETVEKYTLEEAKKRIREEAKAAKEAKKNRKSTAGFHVDETTPDDATYNVLAKGEFSSGEGTLFEVRALMADGGKVRLTAYPCGVWFRGVSAVGASVEEAGSLLADMLIGAAEALNATGKASTVATLSREYVKAAKEHTYNPPKRN